LIGLFQFIQMNLTTPLMNEKADENVLYMTEFFELVFLFFQFLIQKIFKKKRKKEKNLNTRIYFIKTGETPKTKNQKATKFKFF